METTMMGYIGVILGLYRGLYRDNGKENGNCYDGLEVLQLLGREALQDEALQHWGAMLDSGAATPSLWGCKRVDLPSYNHNITLNPNNPTIVVSIFSVIPI